MRPREENSFQINRMFLIPRCCKSLTRDLSSFEILREACGVLCWHLKRMMPFPIIKKKKPMCIIENAENVQNFRMESEIIGNSSWQGQSTPTQTLPSFFQKIQCLKNEDWSLHAILKAPLGLINLFLLYQLFFETVTFNTHVIIQFCVFTPSPFVEHFKFSFHFSVACIMPQRT